MLFRLLILLAVSGIVEIALLVWLVDRAGLLATIGIVVAAGLVGTALAKWQGLRAWRSIRADLAAGRPPASAVVDAAMILFAGLLLLLPGLISDLCGLLLLIPPVRAALRVPLTAYFAGRIGRRMRAMASRAGGSPGGEVIDAEFRRADLPAIENRTPPQ